MTPIDPASLCRTCQGRLDSVLWAVGRHPGCSKSPPISGAAETRLLAALTKHLGAVVEIRSTERTA